MDKKRDTSNMSRRNDEHDRTGPNAPLLASDGAVPFRESNYDSHNDSEIINPGLEYTGGWFIWALTFSAGISGLLFGYEYVQNTPYAYGYPTQYREKDGD